MSGQFLGVLLRCNFGDRVERHRLQSLRRAVIVDQSEHVLPRLIQRQLAGRIRLPNPGIAQENGGSVYGDKYPYW